MSTWLNVEKMLLKNTWWAVFCLLPWLLAGCGGGSGVSTTQNTTQNSVVQIPQLNRVAATINTALGVPGIASITSGNGEVALTWNPVSGAVSYNVYYLTYPGVTVLNARQLTGVVSGTPITGLPNTVNHYFRVTAVNAAGESAASAEVAATPMPAVPGIPGNVRLEGGFAKATLRWQAVPYATSYNVYYGTSPGLPNATSQSIKGVTLLSREITGLNIAPGRYFFRVTAVDVSGEGPPSVELSAIAKGTFIAAAGGFGHSVAMRIPDAEISPHHGTLWAWGDNSKGQLGDNTWASRLTAVQAFNSDKSVGIATGYHHTVALKTDMSVMDWGYNNRGQLGVNSVLLVGTDSNVARQVSLAPYAMTAVAAGFQHTVALKNDGTVWAWGYNLLGSLGYSSLDCTNPVLGEFFWTCSDVPTQVTGITGVVTAIAGGANHTLAVTADGQVWSWGRNDTAQLGTLGVSCNKSITQMPLTTIQAQQGELGFVIQDMACNTTPVQVNAIPGQITAVTAGTRHSVALMSDGTVWSWGGSHYGQLGYSPSLIFAPIDCTITTSMGMPCSYDPKQVTGLDHIIAISAGSDHTLALRSDGTVWAWGYNNSGQLGRTANGETPNQTPQQIAGLSGVIAIAAGAYHSLAVKDDGTVWAWGDNSQGQLGNGSKTASSTPVKVQGLMDPVVIIPGRLR